MSRGSRNILRRKEKQLQLEKEIEARRLRWKTAEGRKGPNEQSLSKPAPNQVPKDAREHAGKDGFKQEKSSEVPAKKGSRLVKMAETYRKKRLERM